jgi:hypothetical protein
MELHVKAIPVCIALSVILCLMFATSTFCEIPAFKKQYFLEESELIGFSLVHAGNPHPATELSWFYLKPLALDYDNTKCPEPLVQCIAEIQYEKTEIQYSQKGSLSLLSTGVAGVINDAGTYIFSVWDGKNETFYRVSIRRSDDYIGYITELLGVPFVYTPKYEKGTGHQTDRGLGADCIAVIVYGKRREGARIPYLAPAKLYDYTLKLGDNTRLNSTYIKKGDILHFGFQTAVISEDVKPVGILTPDDKIIHAFHSYVEELKFSKLPYNGMPFDILRWK